MNGAGSDGGDSERTCNLETGPAPPPSEPTWRRWGMGLAG